MPTPLTRARTVHVSSVLPAHRELVWELVRRPATLRFVAWPLLRFPGLERRRDEWREGETVRTRLLLLGLLPLNVHRLTLQRLDPVARVLSTDEGGGLITQWRHLITVEAEGDSRCRYTDVVELRAGVLTVPVALFAHGFYRWRHRRWRKLVRLAGQDRTPGTVTDVHARVLPAPLERCAFLLDDLATDRDRLWPSRHWPAMRFAPGLVVGAAGGHGPVRYDVAEVVPGRLVRFRFTAPRGFGGGHELRLEPDGPEGTSLRHVLTLTPSGAARLTWPLVFRPLHDALLEDALDQAEAAVAGTAVPPPRWSPYVRLLRRLARPRARGATQPAS